MSCAINNCVFSSPADPFAIYKYRMNSAIVSRSFPSAIFEAMETAALLIWSLKPKSFPNSPLFEIAYNSTASDFALCQHSKSSKRITRIRSMRGEREKRDWREMGRTSYSYACPNPATPAYLASPAQLARHTLFSRVPQVALVTRPADAAPPFHLQIHIARTTQTFSLARKRHALFW